MLRKPSVTFISDLRINGGLYAAAASGIALYFAMTAIGAELWLTVLLPLLIAGLLGFLVRRRHR